MIEQDTPCEPVLDPPYKEWVKQGMATYVEGSVHSHDEIANILNLPYGTQEYYNQVQMGLDEFKFLGKRLVNIRGIGYRVLFPYEYPEAAYYDARKAGRSLKRGLDNVRHAPIQKMDDPDKRRIENIGVHFSRTYVNLVSAVAEVKELAGIERNQRMLLKGAKEE